VLAWVDRPQHFRLTAPALFRHNETASRKPRKIRSYCTPEVSGVAPGV
jgi:hypothetical protein